MSTICVLGLGYIGLPTASMFATQGHRVVGVDINPELVDALREGKVLIKEPGLNLLVQSATQSGNLTASLEPEAADIFVIAVPTPLARPEPSSNGHGEHGSDPKPDLSHVIAAAEAIVPHLEPGCLVILESTSPPGTTAGVLRTVLERSSLVAGSDFSLAYCAERVLPGRILMELVTNDRIVGGIDRVSAQRAKDLYSTFVEGQIYKTDATTAEMAKLMENTYRDVNIALANEFARVAETVGIDVHEAIGLANRHPRVDILKPGPGVGGHCIAVDPWFIVDAVPGEANLVREARRVNDHQPARVTETVREMVIDIESPTVAVLGLAYKADIDDLRESPSLTIVRELRRSGIAVQAHDPLITRGPAGEPVESELAAALRGADMAVVLTNHAVYRELDPTHACVAGMAHRRLLDTRNCVETCAWQRAGFEVRRLGVGESRAIETSSRVGTRAAS